MNFLIEERGRESGREREREGGIERGGKERERVRVRGLQRNV